MDSFIPMSRSLVKFRLVYSQTTFKEIKKLDSVAKKKLQKKILFFQQNPLENAKRLTGTNLGQYRWRVGSYRIIFDLEKNKITILHIGHRKEIYK